MIGTALRVEVTGQGGLVKVAVRGHPRPGPGGRRRGISTFSRGSRKRLLERGAMVDRKAEGLYAVLTYADPVPPMSVVERHRLAMVKRIKRRYPGVSLFWTKGVESTHGERKYNPHQNLVLFGVEGNWIPHSWLVDQWQEVVGESAGVCWLEPVSGRRVSRYLGRYLAAAEVGVSLDYMTYLTGEKWVGRFWGVVNRKAIPWAGLVKMVLREGRWLYRVKRSARKVWGGVNKARYRGFTLFVGDIWPWLTLPLYFGAEGY